MRRISGLVVAFGVVMGGIMAVLSMPLSVHAEGSIGGRPALPRKDEPRSQSIFIHTIKKGASVSDKVLVSNDSDTTQTITLSSVDAIPSNTGAFTCKQDAEAVTDAGGWISLDRHQVTLKAGASDIVDFTVTAPAKADVGEHNACIVLETKGDEGEVSGNLRIRTRAAIRVALTIPGTLHREVKIDSYGVTVENYHQRFGLTVHNTGNVSADTDVTVRLKSMFGETIYRNQGQYPVLPGNKLELSFENDKSPFFGGWYFADASISYDKNANKWGTQSAASLQTVKADRQLVFIMPQPLAILLFLAVIVLVGWALIYLYLRRQRDQHVADNWRSYRVKDGDTLERLAVATGTSWKRIAKVNDLKPPYALKAGQVVRVPKVEGKSKKNTSGR